MLRGYQRSHTMTFDELTLEDARRFNHKLNRVPRFKIRNRFTPLLVQSLLRMSQLGLWQLFGSDALARAGIRVERRDASVDGARVAVRILRPSGTVRAMVLDIHGGGWVIGNARMNDQLNAAIIAACDVAVVSVDYRLFGATPLSGLLDDCLVAARWLLADGLPEYAGLPVFIVGESAGGHLAAATLLQLAAWPHLRARIRGAVMYYGVYDLTGTPSVRGAGPETLVLDGPGMTAAMALLTPGLGEQARRAAPLSPLYGDLQGFPPALMYAGERDPLRDDTTLMAARWRQAAPVEMHLLPEAPHGLIHFPTRMAKQVQARTHAWLRERMTEPSTSYSPDESSS